MKTDFTVSALTAIYDRGFVRGTQSGKAQAVEQALRAVDLIFRGKDRKSKRVEKLRTQLLELV